MPCGEYFTSYESRMGLVRWRIQKVALVLGLPVPFVLPFVLQGGDQSLVTQMYIFGIAVLGLNVILGYAGEIVLAQGAFMAIGAYSASRVIAAGGGLLPALVVGGLLAALVAVAFGLPSFRVKGFYIAISTLALQFIAEWFFNNDRAEFIHGGTQQSLPSEVGLVGDLVRVGGGTNDIYYISLLALGLFAVLSLNLSRTGIGRTFRAVHENDLAAGVLGVNVFRNKLLAFAIGGFMIGVVTVLQDTIQGVLQNVAGVLGGSGATALTPVLFGVIIIVVLAVEPKGVLAALGQLKEYLRKWPYAY